MHVHVHTHVPTDTRQKKRVQNPNKVTAGRGIFHAMSQETRAIGPEAGIPENLFEQPYYALYVFRILKILLPNTVLAQPKSVLCTMCIPDAH